MSNFFQSTNINAGKYYQNGIEIDLGAQGVQGAQGIHGAAANHGAQGSTGAQGIHGAAVSFPTRTELFQNLYWPSSIIIWYGPVGIPPDGTHTQPIFTPAPGQRNDWYVCNGQTVNGALLPNIPALTGNPLPINYIIYLP